MNTPQQFLAKADCIAFLDRLAADCQNPNWDGYGATSVNEIALQNARRFINNLPDDLPLPECSIEPDGRVSLDWFPSRHRTFTLSIDATDRIPYAWVDGSDRGHAVARLHDGQIPDRILNEIRRFSTNDTALRTV